MTKKFKRTSGILIPKNNPSIEEIKQLLTRRVYDFDGSSHWIEFYETLNKFILVPRYYSSISENDIIDETCEGDNIDIESNIVPRVKSQQEAIDLLVNDRNGVLKLETGRGKTVVTIAAISKIKKRTIIFVHKDTLIQNWTSEFIKHTNLTEDDIGKLSTKNFIECLKKPIILCTPHVISIVLKKPKVDRLIFIDALQSAGIGMMVVDECHMGIGPEQFSKASLMINSRRNWGLSATPGRNDECTDIIHHHLGPIKYIPPEENEIMSPLVCRVHFDFDVYSKHGKYISWGGKFNQTKYANMMRKSEKFMEYTKTVILDAYDKDRTILVLGTTINTMLELAERCALPRNEVGIFMAGAVTNKDHKKLLDKVTDTKDLYEAFHNRKVIFSTYQMARDGNNNPNLDCLIMLTTTNNVEQAAGRILRLKENKKQPLVIDLIDTGGPKDKRSQISLFERYAQSRLDLYLQKDWEIKDFECKEGKLYGYKHKHE